MLQTRVLVQLPPSYEVFLVRESSSNSLPESDQGLGKTLSLGEPHTQALKEIVKSPHSERSKKQ